MYSLDVEEQEQPNNVETTKSPSFSNSRSDDNSSNTQNFNTSTTLNNSYTQYSNGSHNFKNFTRNSDNSQTFDNHTENVNGKSYLISGIYNPTYSISYKV